jgi:hypothetical protein
VPRINYRLLPLDPGAPGIPGLSHEWFPILPVKLRHGPKATPWFPAIVDSGSHCCLFHNELASILEIDLGHGTRDRVRGFSDESWVEVVYLNVSIQVAGETLVLPVGFCQLDPWPGLLGRAGFFENFIVTFDHAASPPGMDIERIRRTS